MEEDDERRYDTEVDFANFCGSTTMLSLPLSWIYPCTGPRVFGGRPLMWKLDERGNGNEEFYATVGLPEVELTSGKWYYEVKILELPQALQFGWARSGFSANPEGGCGDDKFSYSCDCVRWSLWHSEEQTPWNVIKRWSPAPASVPIVIGCMLDLDRREIRFSVDGLVDEEPDFLEISLASSYFPALTMSVGEVEFNFGEEGFSCLPEGYSAITCYLTKEVAMDVAAAKKKLEQEKNEKLL